MGAAIVRYNSNDLGNGAMPSIVDSAGISGIPYEATFAFDAEGDLYDADCGNHAGIRVYPTVATSFSASLAPSASYTNAALTSVGCTWGIAIR